MKLNSENTASHLIAFGYSAKAGTIKDKKTGESQDVVFINGLGSINAYLNLSDDPKKFGLKLFGSLQPGYAPVIVDESGDAVRETVDVDSETVTRAKRGAPLDAAGLKRKNNEISLTARQQITGAVLAAFVLEASGGDIELLKDGFRLQKWDRSSPRHSAEGDDQIDASGEFAQAATPKPVETPTPRYKRAQGPSHP